MILFELAPGEQFELPAGPAAIVQVSGTGRLVAEALDGERRVLGRFEEAMVRDACLLAELGPVGGVASCGEGVRARCLRLGQRRIVGEGQAGAKLSALAVEGELILRVSGAEESIRLVEGRSIELRAGPRGHDWELRGLCPEARVVIFEAPPAQS